MSKPVTAQPFPRTISPRILDIRYHNPAGRLLALFSRISPQDAALKLRFILAKAYGIPPESPEIYNLLVGMRECYEEIAAWCELNSREGHLWRRTLPKLEIVACPTQIDLAANDYVQLGLPAVMYFLESIAEAMAQEAEMVKDELVELKNQLAAVADAVNRAELSAGLRRWLLELLRMMREAIDRYEISGARGLRKTFYRLVGELREVYEDRKSKAEAGDQTAKSEITAIKEVADILTIIDKATATAARVPSLLEMSVASAGQAIEAFTTVTGYLF